MLGWFALSTGMAHAALCPEPPQIAVGAALTRLEPARRVTLVRGVDGDTAHFGVDGIDTKVRFLWVDTEEIHGPHATPFGAEVGRTVTGWMQRASTLHLMRQLDRAGQPHLDAYGRTLALVFVDGELLQARLVREGLSPYYTKFGCAPGPVHQALLQSEAVARGQHRGLWADHHPTDYHLDRRWLGLPRIHCRPDPFTEPLCEARK